MAKTKKPQTKTEKMSPGRKAACTIVAAFEEYRQQCLREASTKDATVSDAEHWNGKAAGVLMAMQMLSSGKAANALRSLCRAMDRDAAKKGGRS